MALSLGGNALRSRLSIVHFAPDEKFIDMALREFEAVAPGLHRLVIYGSPRHLKHVKTPCVEFLDFKGLKALFKSDECLAVIFHSMSDPSILKHIPPGKVVIWLGWGFDYYNRLLSRAFPDGLCMPATAELMRSKPTPRLSAFQTIKHTIKRKLVRPEITATALLSRVDYFSPVLDVEHQMACDLNPWFKPNFAPWNYGTAEDDLGAGTPDVEPLGENILVGNSATAENNHLEVFNLLKKSPYLGARKIVVPLSYGDDWYKHEIIRAGSAIFGEQFMPLTGFMKTDDYLAVLQSCGHVFMNHFRQQGFGNICIMMLKGARIYMNSASPLYHWLHLRGASIRTMDELEIEIANGNLALDPLSPQEKAEDTRIVLAHFGRENQRLKTRRLIDTALQNS